MRKVWHETPYPGVRFRRHPTRKHGVKRDAYFQIRYQKDGKRVEESLGWASDGMSAHKAALILAELRENARTGRGETSLAERRMRADQQRTQTEAARVTFGQFWKEDYLPQALIDKDPETMVHERSVFKKWLSPAIADLPFAEISPLHVEKIKSTMLKAGRAPRTVEYCLAVTRQVFNTARRRGVFTGENPVRQVKKPRVDNRRTRFLTPAQAEELLVELGETDPVAREMALLSLHCGLRAGEIFRLTRAAVNFEAGTIAIKDAKSGRSRFAYMTEQVRTMLQGKGPGAPEALLYPGPGGKIRREVPGAFRAAVDRLGFNEGITDRRDRIVFHSCRHSYASWLAQKGVDSREIQRLLGHETAIMTERYSHLAPHSGRATIDVLEGLFNEAEESAKQGEDKKAEQKNNREGAQARNNP